MVEQRERSVMEIGDSVTSGDGVLRITLATFDAMAGKGQVKVEELAQASGRFYVRVTFGSGSESCVYYRMGDTSRTYSPLFEISTLARGDTVAAIDIVCLGSDS